MKKIAILLSCIIVSSLSLISCKNQNSKITYSGSVMLYTTLEESIVNDIKYNFEEKYEGIVLDYYFGNADLVKDKLKSSFDLDLPEVDVIIINNKNDLQNFKNSNYVTEYISKEDKRIKDEYKGILNDYYVVASDENGNENYIALVSNSMNTDNAKLLIDYLLSKNGQEGLIKNNLKSVRKDIK